LKKHSSSLLALLSLTIAITVGCGDSNLVPKFAKVAFLSSRTVSPATSLFVANLDGTTVTPVPNVPSGYFPSISADLKNVAFESGSNIFVGRVDGTNQTQLTTSNSALYVRISPNGNKIVYAESVSGTWHFWISNLDGSGKLDLTPAALGTTADCFTGSFSADSSQVVFNCYNQGSFSMYTVKADGSGLKTVLVPSGLFIDTPSFTPDGKKIVFFASGPVTGAAQHSVRVSFTPGARPAEGIRQAGSTTPTYGITSVNVDGTGATLMVPGSYEAAILNSTLYYTLYTSSVGFNQIYKANPDGTSAVSISDGTSNDRLGQSQD